MRRSKYIHQIAIAGYVRLLFEVLKESPKLIDTIDKSTGRSLLCNAAWGGSLKCVSIISDMEARRNVQFKFGSTALSYAKKFGYSDCEEYLRRPVPPSFFIKHVQSQLYVVNSIENNNPFRFRFVDKQLLHVQTGKFACSVNGRKNSGLNIGLYEERSSCFPFDYDRTRCLLTGGDSYFVKVDLNNALEWHQYLGTRDENNPFYSGNGFEFEIIFSPSDHIVSDIS